MTLGGLFDGSGGFPLAGLMNGITPIWTSEIEPFPLRVTEKRFPHVPQLGDVCEIHGGAIQPADIITFGSPCQDMSIAGKRSGMTHKDHGAQETTRSGLFYEAVRIIGEMREATNGSNPAFAVWENVPGALSGNKGEDFRNVIEALARVADKTVSIPMPDKRKWANAGAVVGDGWSIAWRILDAQYFGVPQRRRRIYLVADFGGERAGKVLFERESVRGDTAQGGQAGQGTAGDVEGSAGGSGGAGCLNPWDNQSGRLFAVDGVFHTLKAAPSGGKTVPDVCYSIAGNMAGRAVAQNGSGFKEGQAYTLNTVDRHCSVYPNTAGTLCASGAGLNRAAGQTNEADFVVAVDCRNLCGNDEISGTLQAKGDGGHSLNYINPVCYAKQAIGKYKDCGVCSTLTANLNRTTGDVMAWRTKSLRRFIVRRLTETECARLQGFPPCWCAGLATKEPTEDELRRWKAIWAHWATVNGKKPKSGKQVCKWLRSPHTSGAEYKLWGNGIALPCAAYVLGEIEHEWQRRKMV